MLADNIRNHARQKYVIPARKRKQRRFSIRAGDVERELGVAGRTPAVCSALKTQKFLKENRLRLLETNGPPSGQSTTVVYTYEFKDADLAPSQQDDPWKQLRGSLKKVFGELGGGDTYLRSERNAFNGERESN